MTTVYIYTPFRRLGYCTSLDGNDGNVAFISFFLPLVVFMITTSVYSSVLAFGSNFHLHTSRHVLNTKDLVVSLLLLTFSSHLVQLLIFLVFNISSFLSF